MINTKTKLAIQAIFIAGIALSLLSVGCSKPPEPEAPVVVELSPAEEGQRILQQMSAHIASIPAFTFETVESLDRIGTDTTAGAYHFTRSVVVQRPSSLYFDLKSEAKPSVNIIANYNGQQVTMQNTTNATWARTDTLGNIDSMLNDITRRFSVPIPFADIVYSDPYNAFIGPNTKGGLAGKETIDGVEYVRLEYADDLVGIKIWTTDSVDALPRRIELTYKKVAGEPKALIDFSAWNLNTSIADDAFTATINPAATELDFGTFVTNTMADKPE